MYHNLFGFTLFAFIHVAFGSGHFRFTNPTLLHNFKDLPSCKPFDIDNTAIAAEIAAYLNFGLYTNDVGYVAFAYLESNQKCLQNSMKLIKKLSCWWIDGNLELELMKTKQRALKFLTKSIGPKHTKTLRRIEWKSKCEEGASQGQEQFQAWLENLSGEFASRK